MFYLNTIDQRLRFGDVLQGYLSTIPNIEKPFMTESSEPYYIDVHFPNFSIVMDPCCNIGGGAICLTPLIPVKSHFWDNPCVSNDAAVINKKMKPIKVIHPKKWNSLPLVDKQDLVNAEPQYNLLNYFVYEKNDRFPSYNIQRELKYKLSKDPITQLPNFEVKQEECDFDTRYYMIDFKLIFHVKCKRIKKPDAKVDGEILASKILQLSIETRSELREKLSFYYGNPPEEDMTI